MMVDMFKLQREWMLLLLVVCFFGKGCWSLKGMRIRVPEVVRTGDTVTLSCEYDLEQVALYSIKWYWNDEEFYRFVPKESPPFRAFSMAHVNVDISRSGPTDVTLIGVRKEQTGDYKCEVSADAPLFHTEIKGAHMTVADLPNGNPVMNLETEKVEIGKKIRAQCHAPGSDPAANITWFLNEQQITPNNITTKISPLVIDTDHELGLKSSKSELELTTNKSHFIQGRLTIKCQTSIHSIWQESVEKSVKEDAMQLLAPLVGTTSSQSHSHTDQVIEIVTNTSKNTQTSQVLFSFLSISTIIIVLLR